jgi:HSP20 family protein
MAQTKKAQENKQTQGNEQTQLESNEQTQTPPSRQAGANQPQGSTGQNQSQALSQRGGSQQRGLSRPGQYSSPFSFMRRFSEEMDRLFDDFGGSFLSPGFDRGFLSPGFGREFQQLAAWSPQTEVFERGDELVVRADLPGLTKDDIKVDIEDDQIIIQGERRDEREENREGFYQSERSYGSFYRSIPLPQGIDANQANATFNNGVLEITLPKPEQKSRGRRIEIGEGGASQNTGEQAKGKTTKQ